MIHEPNYVSGIKIVFFSGREEVNHFFIIHFFAGLYLGIISSEGGNQESKQNLPRRSIRSCAGMIAYSLKATNQLGKEEKGCEVQIRGKGREGGFQGKKKKKIGGRNG